MAILYSPYLIQNSGIAKLSSCVKLGIYCTYRYIIHWEYIILSEPDMVLLLLHSVRHLVNYPCHVSQLFYIWFKVPVLVYYNSRKVLSKNCSKNLKRERERSDHVSVLCRLPVTQQALGEDSGMLPDTRELTNQGLMMRPLPLLLYLIAQGLVNFQCFVIDIGMKFLSRVFGILCSW